MARKKQIEIEIQETKNDSPKYTELEVLVNKKVIGEIKQIEEQYEAVYMNGSKMRLPQVDEAVEYLIMQYNLHDM